MQMTGGESFTRQGERMQSNEVPVERGSRRESFKRAVLMEAGFKGFVTFAELREGGIEKVPHVGGIYVVLREAEDGPVFLEQSVGGRFKGKDPTVEIPILQAKWIDDAACLYIGKANDLRRRLREYVRFGSGHRIGHWGGRYIWQVEGSEKLKVAWKETKEISPRDAEIDLLVTFGEAFEDSLPFANLVG
jgi:hypothetical protein